MTIEQIVSKFQNHPHYMQAGAGKMAKRWKCSKEDIYTARRIVRTEKEYKTVIPKNFPKILILDIETAPIRGAVWRIWNTDMNLNQIESDWFCLTWAAKWLYSTEVLSDRLISEEAVAEDDYRLLKGIWELVNEADIVIAHNGKKFDIPRLNTRFLINGFPPPASYTVIDTLIEAKKYFAFTSNKLDFINKQLGLSRKLDNGTVERWNNSVKGDNDALKDMEIYNKGDVEALEETYLTLRPWIKSHPNIGIYMSIDTPVCSACGNTDLKQIGFHYTHTGKYPKFKCECGAESRSRNSVFEKTKVKNLLVSVPGR